MSVAGTSMRHRPSRLACVVGFPTKRSIFHDLFADDLDSTAQLVAALDESDPMAAVVTLVKHRTADVGDPLVPGLLMAAITHAGRDRAGSSPS